MFRVGRNLCRRWFCNNRKDLYFSKLELRDMIQQPNQLRDTMIKQIQQLGELKVAQYWKQALTDQKFGYYRQENVFSKEGDFTTAPEISTLFGQIVATWLVVFMQTASVNVIDPLTNAVNKKFRLVELGGGRGMLMQDILRSFHSYQIKNNFDLSFIEISDYNRKQQQNAVMEQFKKNKSFFRFDFQNATPLKQEFISQDPSKDINLRWFSRLEDLLKEDYEAKKQGKQIPFTIFVMNQFFDALPVTILEYTEEGWKQKVLTVSQDPLFQLQLVNSRHKVHEKLMPTSDGAQIGDRIQISPQSLLTMDMMAKIIKYAGGGILNIDYGGKGPFVNSIRAIKKHKYIPQPYYWQVPGTCDLSAHVAFSALAQYAERVEGVKAFQLIPQQFFLQALGIGTRVETLSKNASKQKVQRLEGEAKRLTDPQQMGQFFKVQIITLDQYGEIYPHISMSGSVY